MKNDRQSMILEIISQENIETQEQLLVRLQERGITSTQATISRDIKQLHLVKEPTGHGTYKYAVSSSRARLNIADKLRTIFHESITSVDCAQNIVVFKTLGGEIAADVLVLAVGIGRADEHRVHEAGGGDLLAPDDDIVKQFSRDHVDDDEQDRYDHHRARDDPVKIFQ